MGTVYIESFAHASLAAGGLEAFDCRRMTIMET